MSAMLILLAVALATVACSGTGVDATGLRSDSQSIRAKRGIVDAGHGDEISQEVQRSSPHKSRQSGGFSPTGNGGNSVALKILNSLDKKVPFPGGKYGNGAPRNAEYQEGGLPTVQFARTLSPSSYAVSPTLVRQVESQPNFGTPYFGAFNPASYKIVSDGTKPMAQIKSIAPGIASFGDLTYSLPSGFPLHGNQPKPLTQEEQTPAYKTSYPGLKNADFSLLYAPSFQRAVNSLPVAQTSEKLTESPGSFIQDETKVAMPLQLRQGSTDLSGYLQMFEKQPLLLGSKFQYHANPSQGYNLGQVKLAAASQGSAPFLSPASNFQGQVVPIETSNGNKQFPQYRGAALGAYPFSNNVGQVPGLYQPLHTQPQLHFANVQAANNANSKPSEEIRTDVEVITKRPRRPPSKEDEDDDSDDGYKDIEKESGRESEENYDNPGGPGKYFKGAQYQTDFKPSKTFPFKAYDEKFGRYSQQKSNDDSDEKSHSNYQDHRSYDDDDDREYKSPASKYHSDYSSSEPYNEKYEDDDEEEESQKYEKYEDDDSEYEPQQYKHSRKYEDSYKRELPKSRYRGVKEEEYTADSRRRGRDSGNGRYKSFSYEDNEGHGTSSMPRKAPSVVYEEFFSTKRPKGEKGQKEAKDTISEKYTHSEKSPRKDSFFRATKSSHEPKMPKAEEDSKYENGESYSYTSGGSNRNSKQNSPEEHASFPSSVAGEVAHASVDHDSFHRPTLVSGKVRSLTTAEVLRDLTGI